MLTRKTKIQSVLLYFNTVSPLLSYGLAAMVVTMATIALKSVPVIAERAVFLFYFFAISQAAFWLGLYPGILAVILSLISFNILIIPKIWGLKTFDILILNASFCALSILFITATHYFRNLTIALLEKQQDLDLAQAIGNIGNWRMNIVRNELLWSEQNYRIFGVPSATPLTYESFIAIVHPEDRDFVNEKWQAALKGGPYDIEHRILVAGETRWLHERATLEFDKNGSLLGAFGTTQDITDLKQTQQALLESQRRYVGIVESAMDAVIAIDENEQILVFNSAAESMFGCRADEVIGTSLGRFLPKSHRFSHRIHIRKFGDDGITKRKMGNLQAIAGVRANGQEFPIEVSISQTEERGKKLYTAILRDITERVRSEKLLNEKLALQDQITKTAASVPGLVCSFRLRPDGTSHLPFAGHAIESVFGFSAELLATDFNPVFAQIHTDDIKHVNELTEKSARMLKPWLGEFRYLHPHKGEIWLESHSMPQREPDGSTLWHGYVLDITERKRSEIAIQDQENQLRLIIDAAPALISYLDIHFKYLRVNKTYEDWFHLPKEHILGNEAREIIGEKAWRIVQPYLEQARFGIPVSFDYPIPYGDNTPRWMHCNYIPDKDEGGNVKGIIVHVVDIDERKQAERKIAELNRNLQHRIDEMQVIFETAPIGLAIAEDTKGFHIRGNPANERLLGLPPGSELSKKANLPNPYRVIQNGEELAVEKLPVQRALKGEFINNQILDVVRPDGKTVILLANATPLFDENGHPRGAIGAFLDISELKRAEKQMAENEERMRLATEATGVGIWEWNVITNQIHWDAQMFRIYGLTPTENGFVNYLTWSNAVYPEDLPQQETILRKTAHEGGQSTREFRILRGGANQQEIRYIQAVETVRRNKQGQIEWLAGTNLDITERKQAAQALQASEERLALGVQVAGLAIAEIDYGTQLIHLSAKASQFFGLGETERVLPRAAVHAAFHPDDRNFVLQRINESLDPAGNGWFDEQHRVLLSDATIRWLHVRKKITFSEDGKPRRPLRATLALLDITQEKETESKILNSEAFVRSVLNSLPEHVAVLAADGTVNTVNEPWEQFARDHDASSNAVSTGVNYLDVCRRSSAAGDPYAQQALEGLEDLFSGRRREFVMEYPCFTPSLDRWFLMRAKRADQGIEGLILSHVDITERKHTENHLRNTQARLALVVEEVKAGYWDWDLEKNTLYLSAEWNRQLGLKNTEAVLQWDQKRDRLHPDDRERVITAIDNYLNGHQPNFELQFRLRHENGSYRWIHSRAALLRDSNNKPIRMLGLNLDITNYIKEKEMNERRDEMEKSFRLYIATQTAAAIAHELNQPLTAIAYYSYVAQNLLKPGNENPQKLASVMEKCGQQAQRAGDVIQQLLTLLHKGESVSEPVDINSSVNDAISLVKSHSQLEPFKIKPALANDLPLVNGNRLQTQKVLVNLLNNGLESMKECGKKSGFLTVTTCRSTEFHDFAQITVSDCGQGVIDIDAINKMFQPFYTTKPSGLGMGLAISRALIEAHGGKMWATQNPDCGLSVIFTLPFLT